MTIANPATLLRPRDKLFLVVTLDLIRERIDVRTTFVHELTPTRIVVAQTEPPVQANIFGREIEAAFFGLDKSLKRPLGFVTAVRELLPAYALPEGGGTVEALALDLPQDAAKPTNLRLHCRLQANDELGITMKIRGAPETLLEDISAGGALVSLPRGPRYALGERLNFRLFFRGGDVIKGHADVRDAFVRPSQAGDTESCGAVVRLKFLNMDTADARLLDRTLNRAMFQSVAS